MKITRDMARHGGTRKRLNAAFAHDLRTPLTVLRDIRIFVQYLPQDKSSKEIDIHCWNNGQPYSAVGKLCPEHEFHTETGRDTKPQVREVLYKSFARV